MLLKHYPKDDKKLNLENNVSVHHLFADSYNLFELGPARPDINGIYTSQILVKGDIDRESILGGSYLFQVMVGYYCYTKNCYCLLHEYKVSQFH